jgi:hypothetical protein
MSLLKDKINHNSPIFDGYCKSIGASLIFVVAKKVPEVERAVKKT